MQGELLLVLGTPGVGKSQLARSLGRHLGQDFVDLGDLVKKEKLYKRFDKKSKSYEIDEGRVRSFIQHRLSAPAVIATHSVGSAIPSQMVRLAIVLRLDPVQLYHRLRRRGWTRRKAWENVESELVDVCLEEAVRLFGEKRVVQIDTTEMSASRVLAIALKAVNVKRKFPWSNVDWLSIYNPLDLEKRLSWKNSTS